MVSWVYVTSIYLVPMATVGMIYLIIRRRKESRSRNKLAEVIDSGLTEPPSLHPKIDPLLCIGCGSCVSACHESDVLGIIQNQAVLISPADCIGHGACKTACPEGAISLVFGTETRGVDLPELSPTYETTVPGIFVAGELGGMGLIKNAISQGQQAINNICDQISSRKSDTSADWDCVIVGCGPTGISASLAAKHKGIRAIVIDRGKIGGTVAHFPRRKLVMTAPAELAFVGKVKFHEVQKEELIDFWHKVVSDHKPLIHENELLVGISPTTNGFVVVTDKGEYKTLTVLLAMGRRGTPRMLGTPGEDLNKVVYQLDDPAQYDGDHVLVVGGGDSALEAANSIAHSSPASVTLCYRGESFQRAKKKNRIKTERSIQDGLLNVKFRSQVTQINASSVSIQEGEDIIEIPNDHVIVCVGGILPTPFLTSIGIKVTKKYGEV